MHRQTVDLYQIFGLPRPEGGAGILQAWIPAVPRDLGALRRPAVLILPGGGYSHVSAREAEPVALRFLAHGYGAFALDYSCAPHPYPTALREAAMAMCWIRRHAPQWSLHPGMVAAVGFSAGGHLCGTLGMCYDDAVLADIGSGSCIRPDALGLCYPVAVSWGRTHRGSFENLTAGDRTLQEKLSLDRLVRPDMPPVYLWHTRQDAAVPCRNSLLLACALEEAGVDFALHLYHRGGHGLSVADRTACTAAHLRDVSADVPRWPEEMIGFFREQGFQITDLE